MCRAQGGCPTKEGIKPWVASAASQESRLAGRHVFGRFNLPSVIERVKDSDRDEFRQLALEHGLDLDDRDQFKD
jgi:hypothetical protein